MGIVQRQQKWQDTQLGQLIIRSAYNNIGSRLMKKRFWLKMRDENAV